MTRFCIAESGRNLNGLRYIETRFDIDKIVFRIFKSEIAGDYAGSFSLESGDLCAGQMPTAQLRKIKNFILSNKEDLMIKWNELTA